MSNFDTDFLSCLLRHELQNKVYTIVFTTLVADCYHDCQLSNARRRFGGEVLDKKYTLLSRSTILVCNKANKLPLETEPVGNDNNTS